MAKHGRIEEDLNEVRKDRQQKYKFAEKCFDKWLKYDLMGKDMSVLAESNLKKAHRAAHAVEMQEQYMRNNKRFVENVISTGFANAVRPEHLLKAVYIGVANSKRGDMFTEIPLQTTDDALIYMNPVFESTLRDGTADAKSYESTAKYFAGETYEGAVGTGDGATLTFTSAAVSPLPVIPYSCRVIVGNSTTGWKVVGTDNGTGTLVGATLDSTATNTIVYATGVFTVTFSAGYAPALNDTIKAVFNWNSETSGNYGYYGKMSLNLTKTRWNARPMPVGYTFSDMTQLMFETTGLGSYSDMIGRAVGDTHARMKDFRAIARAKEIALSNTTYTFDTDFAAAGEISFKSHAQRLTNEIGRVSATLYDSIQRGAINKIIAGPKAVNYMTNHDRWSDVSGDFVAGVYQAGKLGNIDVYQCPSDASMVATDEMILTYKNPDEALDLGLLFGTLTEITAELRYPQFYTDGNICSVEDSKIINTQFIRLMKLTSLA